MRSVWVDSTTIVSVRTTPSIDRIRLISSSNDDVFAGLHLEHERVHAGDVMALEHVVERLDLALEACRWRAGDRSTRR